MKTNWVKLGVPFMCCAALTALVTNQKALAQQRFSQSPATSFFQETRRITAADPSFRIGVAAVLDSVKEKNGGVDIRDGFKGAGEDSNNFSSTDKSVVTNTITKSVTDSNSVIVQHVANLPPDFSGTVRALTPTELALAETLFKDVNVSRAKNLYLTKDGITGSVRLDELGLTMKELEAKTRLRLEAEAKSTTEALKGLGR